MRALLRPILLFGITALIVPVAVFSTPPTWEPISFDDTFVYAPGAAENPCSFELTYHNKGTYLVASFVDSSGALVRQFARGVDFLETYSANGKEISSRTPATVHFDAATNTLVGTGNQRHFIVPGAGIVYAQAGRFVIDLGTGSVVSVSGLDVPQSGAFCAALAP
jgi:hypothetical protein